MANDIVAGLFGLSPSQVQQQQQVAIQQQANAYAQQDPFQRAAAGMYQAGAGLGGIGAGMMGMVNPEVDAAQMRQDTAGKVAGMTVGQLRQYALTIPDPRMKMGIMAYADQKEAQQSTLAHQAAQTLQLEAAAANSLRAPTGAEKIQILDRLKKSYPNKTDEELLRMIDKPQFESMSNEEKLVTAAAKSQNLVEGTPEWNKFTADAYQKLMDKKTNITVNAGGQASQKPMTAAQQVKFENQLADDFKSAEQVMQNSQNIVRSISDISGSKGLSARTGYTGYAPAWMQGKEAMTAQNRIDTLKGKVTQMGKSMATMSGAIGPMAVQEWKIVSDAINAIDPTAGNFNEQLASVQSQAEGTAKRIKDLYDRQYSDYFEKYPKFHTQNLKTYSADGNLDKPQSPTTDAGYENWKKARGLK